tara:strand:- start:2742 stop:3413 length:672 start_codon:yes stop_codon:yes gene_type:complete
MQGRISKKIILYLFILLTLVNPINREFHNKKLEKNYSFEILSLSEFNDKKIMNDLLSYKNQNLLFLKKEDIYEIIKKYKIIEDYNIYKNYPSKLIVNFKKTQFLAITQKEGVYYYIGSNGNLIKTKKKFEDLPIIFGDVDVEEFLKLKKLVDNSIFDFREIKNLYYFKSKRWDIETKEGLLLRLPRKNLDRSFQLFLDFINNKDTKDIDIIDLRQNNQIILNG